MFCTLANVISESAIYPMIVEYVLNAAGNPALLCVLGNYLLIHLKEAAELDLNGGTSYRPKTISVMDFGEEMAQTRVIRSSCEL